MNYLRRTTSITAGDGPGTTIHDYSPAVFNERRRGQRLRHHDQVSATHGKYLVNQNAGAGNN
jgi:hypothetical protein